MKKIISLFIVIIFFTLKSIAQIALSNGLAVSYPFTGNANDVSGNNFNGTVFNTTLMKDRFGNANSAYFYNGSTSYIKYGNVLNNVFAGVGNKFSISVWVKPFKNMTYTGILGKDADGACSESQQQFVLAIHNNQAMLLYTSSLGTGNAVFANGSINITDTSHWYHIVATYNGTVNTNGGLDRVKFYVDNVQDSIYAGFPSTGTLSNIPAGTAQMGTGTKLTTAGSACSNSSFHFHGGIDDIRIYNRLLNTSEIDAIYNGTTNVGIHIFGSVYNDINQNCIKESTEGGLASRKALITPGNIIVETNQNGIWYVDSLPTGIYNITIDTTDKWLPTCPITQSFTVVDPDLITMAPHFGFVSTQPCPEPNVSVHMPFMRRCFSNQRIYVKACNMPVATGALTNAYVELKLDSLITPGTSSLSFTSLGNHRYKFDIGTLNPSQCNDFWVDATISCNAILSRTLCMEAKLYPADSCVFDTIPATTPAGGVAPCKLPWDKSSLMVTAFCEVDSVYFKITNTGDLGGGDMDCYAPIRIYVDGVYTILDSVKLLGGETITMAFNSNGKTWRLEVDQHPLHPGNSNPNATIEGCGNPSNWTPDLVNILPLDDADPVVDIYCGLVTGSYDPNDKTGYPLGVGNNNLIYPNGELNYVVRFQNTGTDTAFTVVIRDTLDVDLDIFSVKSGASSHNYTFKMYGSRVLEWTFNNIMLPDSSADQAGSNGFVTFLVKQNPNLPDGTVINNKVAIYFDFNAPIITNTTKHIIGRNIKQTLPVSTTVVKTKKQLHNILHIYPNPTENILNIVLNKAQQFTIEIYSIDGRLIDSKTINNNSFFDVSAYPSGMYFIKATSQNGDVYKDKFVKE